MGKKVTQHVSVRGDSLESASDSTAVAVAAAERAGQELAPGASVFDPAPAAAAVEKVELTWPSE